MSKVKIQGNASGTGVLTVTAPNTSTDRTITLPDTTGTLLDENSSVPAANLTGTVADARISALTASKLTGALPAISGASLTGITTGKVLQVVSHFITTTITLNSSSYSSVISKAITPVAAGSTFSIFTVLDGVQKDATSNYIRGKLTRSGTGVSGGASFINQVKLFDHYGYDGFISENTDLGTLTNVCHDNPSYTLGNTITYGVDARRFDGSGTILINKWNEGTTSILIMEIGA